MHVLAQDGDDAHCGTCRVGLTCAGGPAPGYPVAPPAGATGTRHQQQRRLTEKEGYEPYRPDLTGAGASTASGQSAGSSAYPVPVYASGPPPSATR